MPVTYTKLGPFLNKFAQYLHMYKKSITFAQKLSETNEQRDILGRRVFLGNGAFL